MPLATREGQAVVRRIDALINMHTQESNRLDVSHKLVKPSIKKHIAYLDSEIMKLKAQVRSGIDNGPDLRNKKELCRMGEAKRTHQTVLGLLRLTQPTCYLLFDTEDYRFGEIWDTRVVVVVDELGQEYPGKNPEIYFKTIPTKTT